MHCIFVILPILQNNQNCQSEAHRVSDDELELVHKEYIEIVGTESVLKVVE